MHTGLATVRARWSVRLQDWMLRGSRDDSHGIRLEQRRIFVLPTGAGLAFAVALLVMLLTSINYALSLGFALTFLLGGIGVASIVHAFRNLLHLQIQPGRCAAVFCGEPARFGLRLDNAQARIRPALVLRGGGGATQLDLPARDSREAVLSLPTTRRGWLKLDRVTVETRYPLGLIRAWSVLRPRLRCLVYPRPELKPPPLPDGGTQPQGRRQAGSGDEDFAGLRTHQPADSPRHVAWKSWARGGALMTKQFAGQRGGEVVLDWQQLPPELGDEARLSRLTAWALAAHEAGRPFSLQLADRHIARGAGNAHLHATLRALALHGQPDDED